MFLPPFSVVIKMFMGNWVLTLRLFSRYFNEKDGRIVLFGFLREYY
jgi:hypothetical protein